MRKLAHSIALSIAALAAAQAFATDDFRVVVPLYGKKAVKADIALNQADLPPGVVAEAYPGFDFKSLVQVTSDKPVDLSGVTWSAVSVLPEGLSLSADGVLTGTPGPTAITSAPFTIAATYAGKTAAQVYMIPFTAMDAVEQPPEGIETAGQEQVSDGETVLTVTPTKIRFGHVARLLPTLPVDVTISNTGTKGGTVSVGQADKPEFKVTHDCPDPLPVGASCKASVVFTPTTGYWVKSTFSIGLGKQAVSVALDGTGENSAVTFTHLPNKGSGQSFGIVATDQIVARQTVIKNTSKYYALGIFDVAVNPAYSAASQFRIENEECPKVLQVGESCTITPIFAPTAKGEYSVYSKLKMNVSGNSTSFSMYGRSAGELKVTRLSQPGAQLPGGYEITIYGDGILPGAKVFFGEAEVATRASGTTSIYATVPPVDQPENTYIRIVNPDGAEATSPVTFKRARTFGAFSLTKLPLEYGKQAVNVPSQWKTFSLTNSSYNYKDTLTISDIQMSGPYEIDTSNSYCAPGKVVLRSYSCTMRVRFVPTADGAAPGEVTVTANGEPLKLPFNGAGLTWDGTPSGSASSNTDLPYSTVLSGNEPVGGATQTKTLTVFFRNTNPSAQLNAYFKLADGSAFSLYSIFKTNDKNDNYTADCIPGSKSKESTLCRADVGSGTRPHLGVRLQATSAAGVGTFYDELVVLDAAGQEQYRIPLWLDVVYDVSVQPYSDFKNTTPIEALVAEKVQLAQEGYRDIWLANVGTHGMQKAESVTLVDKSSPDLYLKSDSLVRSTTAAYGTLYTDTCGKLVNSDEHSGCLADDVSGSGGSYKNHRVRVYFKPMSSGARTATLRIAHRGQGANPLDLPVTIRPFDFNGVFSSTTAASEVADIQPARLSANYEVDQTNNSTTFKFYLNSTDDSLMKGYFVLSGDGTEKADYSYYAIPVNDTGTTSGSSCGMKTKTAAYLCTTTASYQNFKVQFTINAKMGAGTYNWTLTFYDPAMNEMTSLPFVVEILNDNQPEVSLDWRSAQPVPNGTWDFGALTVATAPGQVGQSVTQRIYLRNLGQYGKLKIETAYIEGGDGAFTFASGLYEVSDNASSLYTSSCGTTSRKLDAYNVSSCVTGDPFSSSYTVVGASITFKPLAHGTPRANLVVWHNSQVTVNPIIIPLAGVGDGLPVEGVLSGAPDMLTEPSGDFGAFTASGGSKYMYYWVHNPGPYGALYNEQATIEGSSYFTMYNVYKAGKTTAAYTTCGSTTSGQTTTGCLADTYDATGSYKNMRYGVHCYIPSTAPAGTYTATLRIKTAGKEHTLPLSCTKR